MNTRKLLLKLSKRFPKSIASKYYDHVGLQIGKLPIEVKKVLVCLDYDESLLTKTMEFYPDIIFTHHPFIYGTRTKVLKADPLKANLTMLLENDNIPIYSFHTNFDEGIGGMNDALAKALNLQNIYISQVNPMMRIGYLAKEMNIEEFAKYAKKCLGVEYGLLINAGSSTVKKVGIIGGGGSGDYVDAMKEDCDIYISGDVSHHIRRDIIRNKFNYLDLPHEIEKIFIPTFEAILKEIDPTLNILTIDHEKEPKVI